MSFLTDPPRDEPDERKVPEFLIDTICVPEDMTIPERAEYFRNNGYGELPTIISYNWDELDCYTFGLVRDRDNLEIPDSDADGIITSFYRNPLFGKKSHGFF